MINWLLKTLWRQKGSVISSSTGVALAFVLIIVMDAAFTGESNQIVAYIRNVNADIWVMQKGVSNMHMASTFVYDWKARRISEIEGVEKATPILYVNTVVKSGGRNWFAYIIGLMPDDIRAGPWKMSIGKSHPEEGEIILPQVISDMAGLKLGDTASIADMDFKISGFSTETFSMANSIAFVSFSDLEDLISTSGTISFIIVDLNPGYNVNEIIDEIENKVDAVNALSQELFINNDFQIAMLMGVEVVSFMTIIGAALGALLIAFTAYTQVAKRKRELAIAKALGYRNKSLYIAILIQSFIITTFAILIALFISLFLLPGLSELVPQITLEVTARALIRMGIIAYFVAVIATIIPTRMVAHVDPLTAFKV